MKGCLGDYFVVGNFCYQKCTESNKFIEPSSNYECKTSCVERYYEKFGNNTNVYICKESCEEISYYITDVNTKKECFS